MNDGVEQIARNIVGDAALIAWGHGKRRRRAKRRKPPMDDRIYYARALSLTQPWATLVAIGAKSIETRCWRTKYRGPIAIQAAKSFPKALRAMTPWPPYVTPLTDAFGFQPTRLLAGREFDQMFPRGAIVAVCDLVECVGISAGASVVSSEQRPDGTPRGYLQDGTWVDPPEYHFGDYTPGRHAFRLANVVALKRPIPCAGKLNVFELEPATSDAIAEELAMMKLVSG